MYEDIDAAEEMEIEAEEYAFGILSDEDLMDNAREIASFTYGEDLIDSY